MATMRWRWDGHDAVALVGVRPQEAASQTAVLVDAAGSVGAAAVAQGDAATFEVAEVLLPFLVGRDPVFLAGEHDPDDQCRHRRLAGAFGDATVAAAMLDRLLHRAVVAGIDGPSYRLRGHQNQVETLRKGVNARAS
ncbi:ATP-binding protein [Streptomyces sp. NPDC055400]